MKPIVFCLVFSNKNYTNFVTNILINLGIMSVAADHPNKVIDLLNKTKIDFILLDLDFSNNASIELLEKLNENNNYSSIYVLISSLIINAEIINNLQKYNVIGYLVKPITKEHLEDKINQLLAKYNDHFPERRHIRVKPSEDELMRTSFTLKSKKNITAKVIDISLGGLAALFYSNINAKELESGSLIEHIKFECNSHEIDADVKVVNKKERFIAFKFTHFYNNSNLELAKYILKKLSV